MSDVAGLERLSAALDDPSIVSGLNARPGGGGRTLEISASSLEDVYRAMRDKTEGLMNANAGSTHSLGAALRGQLSRYDDAFRAQSPSAMTARQMSRQARQERDALEVGWNAFGPALPPTQLLRDFSSMPESALGNVRAGAQARLEQQIGERPFATIEGIGSRANMGRRLDFIGAPSSDIVDAAQIEAARVRNADFISPNTGSQTNLRGEDALQMTDIPVTTYGWVSKLADFAFRRINALTEAEMTALVRMGIEPADLQRLQVLAQRDPDAVPSVIKGLVGSQVGVQSSNRQ
jgi:hypothetical protein